MCLQHEKGEGNPQLDPTGFPLPSQAAAGMALLLRVLFLNRQKTSELGLLTSSSGLLLDGDALRWAVPLSKTVLISA